MKARQTAEKRHIPWKSANTTPSISWLNGKDLSYSGTGAGTAYIDETNGIAGYSLATGQSAIGYGAVPLPSNWGGKYTRLSVAWLPAGTAAGTVRFALAVRRVKDGTAISTLLTSTVYDAASGGTATPTVTAYTFGTALPTDIGSGEFASLGVRRRGDLSDDTYEDNIYVVAIGFEIV